MVKLQKKGNILACLAQVKLGGIVIHEVENIGLTTAEISGLWRTYQSDSMSICVLGYFNSKVRDGDFKKIIEFALDLSKQHINKITEIFNKEGYPIPLGFTESDVNLNAPPLFTDNFYLFYLRYMARIGLGGYAVYLPQMVRQDILDFFSECISSSLELNRRIIFSKKERGLYTRSPMVEIPRDIDFIDNKNFLAGFFGEKRRMIASEINDLFMTVYMNAIAIPLQTGFLQVVKSNRLKAFLKRGNDIASQIIKVFSAKLQDEQIPVSMPSETFVTDSTEAPFSDKLIMFHKLITIQAGIVGYGTSLVACMRHDLLAEYLKFSVEVGKYGADGINLMIEKGWLEQPPQAINHNKL